ncbi:hypothetical protein RYH80_18245 [Halobaculum sp. MBLA0147]|uniref:hypothetical protein n=1 Tax=Halobaculum sp. MBLA0147 TaxID=3079934 RepID=UPI003523FDEB
MANFQPTLSHPKNMVGVPLAMLADGATGPLIQAHLVRAAGKAKLSAISLGLLTPDRDLTPEAVQVTAAGEAAYGSVDAALEELSTLQGSRKRFVDVAQPWTAPLQRALATHPLVGELLTVLPHCDTPLSLPRLTQVLAATAPALVDACLLADDRSAATDLTEIAVAPTDLDAAGTDTRLLDVDVYQSQTVSHLKSILWHAGVLTSAGADTSQLTPHDQMWALDKSTVINDLRRTTTEPTEVTV